jgi:hypothetical protein
MGSYSRPRAMNDPTSRKEVQDKSEPDEASLGWIMERERRMALEQIAGDGSDSPEKEKRSLQILREILAEVKAGRKFTPEEVLAHWHKDDEQRQERS